MASESTFIDYYLTTNSVSSTMVYRSTLVAALRDVRAITGRDLQSGKVVNEEKAGSWLGCIGYFLILDQIGTCLDRTDKKLEDNIWIRAEKGPRRNRSSIERAILLFSTISPTVAQYLYFLRCALTHDFSLVHTNNGKFYHFRLLSNRSSKLIDLPNSNYAGPGSERSEDNVTTINIGRVGNLVEGIYKKLISLNKKECLKVRLRGGLDELMQRYFMNIH